MDLPQQAFLFPGEAMLTGIGGPTRMHSHLAMQITVGLGMTVRVDLGDGIVTETDSFLFRSKQRHRIDSEGPRATFFVDPSVRTARQYDRSPPNPSPETRRKIVASLVAFAGQNRDWNEASMMATEVKNAWLTPYRRLPFLDARIARTVDSLSAQTSFTELGWLAHQVDLSPSRFAALFSAHVGLPFRRFLVWRRLILAVQLMAEGANVTEAAVETGFADTAHMSRVFLQTFGLSPSVFRKVRCVTSLKNPLVMATADHP